jgi:hypothetical protein
MIQGTADQRSAQTARARWTLPRVFSTDCPAPRTVARTGTAASFSRMPGRIARVRQSELIGQAAEEFLSDGSRADSRAARQPANDESLARRGLRRLIVTAETAAGRR